MLDLNVHFPALADGDAVAFGRWLAGAEPALRASLRPFAARLDVEAMLQEALLRVWQVAPRHAPDGHPNSLLRLAMRVARNLCLDELRRARVTPTDDDALERALAAAEAAALPAEPDPLLRRILEECRDRLPDKPAAALEARLKAAGTQPDEVIAAGLRMRTNTFLQNVTRARKLLAACLEKRKVNLEEELA